MSGAGEALQTSAIAALAGLAPLSGAYAGQPLQAAFPHALVEADLELDWGHKSGKGREVRFAVTLRDEGERPDRLQRLIRSAEAAIEGMPSAIDGWRLISLHLQRVRTVREGSGRWATVIEYRARLLEAAD